MQHSFKILSGDVTCIQMDGHRKFIRNYWMLYNMPITGITSGYQDDIQGIHQW
jgi:hypothetical protein